MTKSNTVGTFLAISINAFKARNNATNSMVAAYLGVHVTQLLRYLSGQATPSTTREAWIATALDMPVEALQADRVARCQVRINGVRSRAKARANLCQTLTGEIGHTIHVLKNDTKIPGHRTRISYKHINEIEEAIASAVTTSLAG